MRRNRGSVFVIALATAAGLAAIVVSIAASQHIAMKAQINRMEQRRARIAAEAGIQRAITELTNTMTNQQATGTTSTTANGRASTLQDDWATLGNNGLERFVVGTCTVRMQIVDAGSFLNLNTATQGQLQQLPLTADQIDSILDWREAGENPRAQGAKDTYYNSLSVPYNAKLAPFSTVDELLQVKGFIASDIYSVPQNTFSTTPLPNLANGQQATLYDILTVDSYSSLTGGNGRPMVNINGVQPGLNGLPNVQLVAAGFPPAVASALLANRPPGGYPNVGAIFTRNANLPPAMYANVLDNLTTSGGTSASGKINLNTASQTVLSTIPSITPDIAQAIVQRQSSGFTKLSDVLQVPGMNNRGLLGSVADSFCVDSKMFIVRVIGEAGSTQVALEATIDLRGSTPTVYKMTQPPFSDYPTRWQWDTNGSITDTVLLEAP